MKWLFLIVALWMGFGPAAVYGQPEGLSKKLGPLLHQRVVEFRQGQSPAAAPERHDRRDDDSSVYVIVKSASPEETVAALESVDCVVDKTHADWIGVSIRVSKIEQLIHIPSVVRVSLPEKPKTYAVISEGLPLMRIPAWHGDGLTGQGVKIAVIDIGFQGFEALLGTELPAVVQASAFGQDVEIHGSNGHGTACAEIVYDAAPGAEYYLINYGSTLDLAEAVDWLIQEGVHIVSFSVGYYGEPDDGTGLVSLIVGNARDNGILWVSAAGNDGQRHWSGPWKDDDGNHFIDFAPGDESMSLVGIQPGETIKAYLKWDDPWNASANDYDLYLYHQGNLVAKSERVQDGTGEAPPLEIISYPVQTMGIYELFVYEKDSSRPARFHLYVPGYGLERWVTEESIVSPGVSPDVMTVGAYSAQPSVHLEPYSSRGPTKDGRVKPDILAPSRVATATYSPDLFPGTSASAPHAAGAAALVKELHPHYGPQHIQEFLESRAIDLGATGKEIDHGAGLISVGFPKTWIVDDDGQQHPDPDFSVIQDALDSTAPGDTVVVDDGLYSENIRMTKPVSLIANASSPGAVVVDRNEADRIVVEIHASDCTLKGFRITNTAGSSPHGFVFGVWLRAWASYGELVENEIYDCHDGISVMKESEAVPPWWYQWDIVPKHNRIVGNRTSDCDHRGIDIYGGEENVLRGNYFQNNTRAGGSIFGDRNCVADNFILLNDMEGFIVRGSGNVFNHNLFMFDRYGGILIEEGDRNVVKHNTFRANGATGLSWPTPGVGIRTNEQNEVFSNIFQETNTIHAWDEYGVGTWHRGSVGNYWHGYTSEDADSNGIWDEAYSIPGSVQPEAEDGYPVVLEEALAVHRGDLNADTRTGLPDALFALQFIAGTGRCNTCSGCLSTATDVEGDLMIGLEEVIYPLKAQSGFIQPP